MEITTKDILLLEKIFREKDKLNLEVDGFDILYSLIYNNETGNNGLLYDLDEILQQEDIELIFDIVNEYKKNNNGNRR
jgi:hypothetical protein